MKLIERLHPWTNPHHHAGVPYRDLLARLHASLQPRSYLEIGVAGGGTLALAHCPAIGIDPAFQMKGDLINVRPATHLFQMPSDDFFAAYDVRTFFPGGVDFALLDGMHLFEFLLRDLINTERYSRPGSVIALHDCWPINPQMAERDHDPLGRSDRPTRAWWTGDVWKLLPILGEHRPDLRVVVADCPPTGLVLLTRLDAASTTLADNYDAIVARWGMSLEDYGFDRFRAEFPTVDSRRLMQDGGLEAALGRGA
jgi:hypothetical protein